MLTAYGTAEPSPCLQEFGRSGPYQFCRGRRGRPGCGCRWVAVLVYCYQSRCNLARNGSTFVGSVRMGPNKTRVDCGHKGNSEVRRELDFFLVLQFFRPESG